DDLVEIVGVAREPGYRSKIAVISHTDGVDPVGACVGPRGSRVRMVVSELRGEKIDIIPYNEEPARFVAKALSPARVREVLVADPNADDAQVQPLVERATAAFEAQQGEEESSEAETAAEELEEAEGELEEAKEQAEADVQEAEQELEEAEEAEEPQESADAE